MLVQLLVSTLLGVFLKHGGGFKWVVVGPCGCEISSLLELFYPEVMEVTCMPSSGAVAYVMLPRGMTDPLSGLCLFP